MGSCDYDEIGENMVVATCRHCGRPIQEEKTAFGLMWMHQLPEHGRVWIYDIDRRACQTVAGPKMGSIIVTKEE